MLLRSVGHFDYGRLVRYYSQTLSSQPLGPCLYHNPNDKLLEGTAAALSAPLSLITMMCDLYNQTSQWLPSPVPYGGYFPY